jgi:hypothetical protein
MATLLVTSLPHPNMTVLSRVFPPPPGWLILKLCDGASRCKSSSQVCGIAELPRGRERDDRYAEQPPTSSTGFKALSPVECAVNGNRQRRTWAYDLSAGYVPVRGKSFNPRELRYFAPTSRF